MSGPWVHAATFCEKVLQEGDGVLSLIRVIDHIQVAAKGSGAPDELPPGPLTLTLVVMLKSDEATGRYPLTVRPNQPSGQTLPDQTIDLNFTGQERGNNVILNVQIEAMEGLYWFDVLLNGSQLLTRVPLRVSYQRMPGRA